ncbi:HEAT repeat domain-containing protein [Paenibacillus sp. P25]|nr:HEAT repeat domain-containing protein [Paenibacillus sp. P25]
MARQEADPAQRDPRAGQFPGRKCRAAAHRVAAGDERPEIRATAAWSLGRIGGAAAAEALAAAYEREPDEAARGEIAKACGALAGASDELGAGEGKHEDTVR